MTAPRADHPALDLFVLEALLPTLGRLVRVLGRKVLAAIAEAGLEAVEERLMAGPVRSRALDLVEASLVGGRPCARSLVALDLGAVPADAPDEERQCQPLAHERDEDDPERQEQDEVPFREVRRQGERRRQRDGAAKPGPAGHQHEAPRQPGIAPREGAPR